MSDVVVKIGANLTELSSALKEATTAVQSAAGQWGGAFGKVGNLLTTALKNPVVAATGALAAFGAACVKSASDVGQYTDRIASLAAVSGTSAVEAAALDEAMNEIGFSTEKLTPMLSSISAKLASGGQAFKDLGIATRDAGGGLRSVSSLLAESIAKIRELPPGAEQAAAASKIFGESWAGNVNLFGLTPELLKENEQRVRDLGLAEEGSLEQGDAYRQSMAKLHQSFHALSIALGNQVVPLFADLANSFAAAVQSHFPQIKRAIKGVIDVFRLFGAIIESVVIGVRLLGEALAGQVSFVYAAGRAMTGHFQEARNIVKATYEQMAEDGNAAVAKLAQIWTDYYEAVGNVSPSKADDKKPTTAARYDFIAADVAAAHKKELADKEAHERLLLQLELKYAKQGVDERKRLELDAQADLAKLKREDVTTRRLIEEGLQRSLTKLDEDEKRKRIEEQKRAVDKAIAEFDRETEAAEEAWRKQHEAHAAAQQKMLEQSQARMREEIEHIKLGTQIATEMFSSSIEHRMQLATQRESLERDTEERLRKTREQSARNAAELDASAAVDNLKLVEDTENKIEEIRTAAAKRLAELDAADADGHAKLHEETEERIRKAREDAAKKSFELAESIASRRQKLERDTQNRITDIQADAEKRRGELQESVGKTIARAIINGARTAIMAYAAQAAAAAFAQGAVIPGIGFAFGGAAAATAFTLVRDQLDKLPSAAGGWDLGHIPLGMPVPAIVHGGEQVLPADIAEKLRRGTGGMTVNVHISAIDGPSTRAFVESPDFSRAIAEAVRNGRL